MTTQPSDPAVNAHLDYRARLERDQLEAAQRRLAENAEQRSQLKTPAERIRVWERRHRLSLPQRADHRLLDVIANATALTRAEVEQEQLRRAEKALA